MPLNWPNASMRYGDLPPEDQEAVRTALDRFADLVAAKLDAIGLPVFASPLWKPWNLFVGSNHGRVVAVFSAAMGGLVELRWHTLTGPSPSAPAVVALTREQFGWSPLLAVEWDTSNPGAALDQQASRHVEEIRKALMFGKLGDLSGLGHLESPLREFLTDHPNYDTNVFVMMRFASHERLTATYGAVQEALGARGMDAVRADSRDYTGELWSNIQTYMHGCKYGIAIFEDFTGARDINPNVSLELGYMVALRKRTLILKEQTLPSVPADLMHRLYRPFDMFNIEATVGQQVGQWADVDLGTRMGA